MLELHGDIRLGDLDILWWRIDCKLDSVVYRMEIRLDFLRYLETDTAVNILACLDDTSDLIRASLVSHFWLDFGEYLYIYGWYPFIWYLSSCIVGFIYLNCATFISRYLIIVVTYKWSCCYFCIMKCNILMLCLVGDLG